jgi:hypothetical protein
MELKVEEIKSALKKAYEEQQLTINSRTYAMTKTVHKQRLTVFSYESKVKYQILARDFSFFDTADWARVQAIIDDIFTFDGNLLSRLKEHWESHAEDFVPFYLEAMGVLGYPFLGGVHSA